MSLFTLALLQEGSSQPTAIGGGALAGIMVVYLAIIVLMVAAMWKIFTKAGKPGWAAIVPIYNIIVLLEIAGKPLWWIVLMLIPFVNLIVAVMVLASVARKFGKGIGFLLGMIFLAPIFYPVLAWGDSQYNAAA
jgi:hypothetical protein